MKVYSGFGYFNSIAKTATVELSLPEVVNTPADSYIYNYINISNPTYNALLLFIKKHTDSGANLPPDSLNFETVQVNLETVSLFSNLGLTATAFDYDENILLITCHEANTAEYTALARQCFLDIATIATTGSVTFSPSSTALGPTKGGVGGLKKM